ncbi:MAG: PEP-CTERM sorting domain-containing protein [Myxococcota bacterium]
MLNARCAAAVLMLLLAAPAGAQVKVLYDTFPVGNPGNSGRIIGFFPRISPPPDRSDQFADPFVVPVGEGDYLLEHLTLRLAADSVQLGEDLFLGPLLVRLLDDGADEPGEVLASWQVAAAPLFNFVTLRPRFANVDVVRPEDEILLEEGRTYWVSVSMVALLRKGLWGKALEEEFDHDTWRHARTNDPQPEWLLPPCNFPELPPEPCPDPLGLMRVEAIPVPEPSATVLALASLGAVIGLARRRRFVRARRD